MAEVGADGTTAAKAAGSTKKWVIMILGAVLLLGGAGAGIGYFIASSQAADEHADEVDDAHDAVAGKQQKGKKSKKTKKPSEPATYYRFDPALVVNFQANGVTRFLQVQLEASTRDPATLDALKLHDPAIRNDLLLLLGNQTEATVTTREGKEQIRAQALAAVRNVVTNEGGDGERVENVFFTSFVMQ